MSSEEARAASVMPKPTATTARYDVRGSPAEVACRTSGRRRKLRSCLRTFSPVVILIATDISNPFYAELISTARAALGDRYELLLFASDPGGQADAANVRRLLSLRPAGLLIDAPTTELVNGLPAGTTAVLLDAPDLDGDWPTVNIDVAGGAAELARHLAGLGHRRVAYLDSVIDAGTFRVRRQAFLAAATELGMDTDPGARSLAAIDDAARTFSAAWPRWQGSGVTAAVGCTDTHAYGILEAARSAGVRVPDELAVAGFDDLPYSRHTTPSLTSVLLPAAELGSSAGTALRGMTEGDGAPGSQVMLPTRLVVRQSTQPDS